MKELKKLKQNRFDPKRRCDDSRSFFVLFRKQKDQRRQRFVSVAFAVDVRLERSLHFICSLFSCVSPSVNRRRAGSCHSSNGDVVGCFILQNFTHFSYGMRSRWSGRIYLFYFLRQFFIRSFCISVDCWRQPTHRFESASEKRQKTHTEHAFLLLNLFISCSVCLFALETHFSSRIFHSLWERRIIFCFWTL